MSDKKLIVSASPHVRSAQTVSGIMLNVVIALIPALAASVWLFGARVLLVSAVSIGVCVLSEYLSRKIMRRANTIGDLSAVVTGLILAFNLPVSIPLWMAAIGAVVAIVVAKQFFGGVGQNFVNPAIAGRIVLMVSFPTAMTTWVEPLTHTGGQALTAATPLADPQELPGLLEMLIGIRAGSLGETCIAALVLGGLWLIIRKIISPAIPLSFIGSVAVVMLIAGRGDLEFAARQLLSGGLVLGAFFMATDYATSPVNVRGKIIFGIGCGLITSLIRLFGSLPEGVSFAIILMNILVPHIEHLTTPRPFGALKEKKSRDKDQEKDTRKEIREKEAAKV